MERRPWAAAVVNEREIHRIRNGCGEKGGSIVERDVVGSAKAVAEITRKKKHARTRCAHWTATKEPALMWREACYPNRA